MSSIQINSQRISTNTALISSLQKDIVDLSNNIPVTTDFAKLNDANVFTENNTFQGDKQFIVNITGSPTSQITFSGRETNIQSGLLCGAGPTAHVDAKVSGVLSVNQSSQGGTDDRAVNYITTPKVELTTAPVDATDATTKDYVDTEISNIDTSNFAKLNQTNTFTQTNNFQDVIVNKLKTDNYGLECVYGEYSNTFYANDNETNGTITDQLNLLAAQQGVVIKISAGSYDEDVNINGKLNIGLECVNVGGRTITELTGTRTLTIDNSERIRIQSLQVNGLTTIQGTLHKHYFGSCSFNGGLVIDGGVGEFMIFRDCEINGLTINATFGGVVYFYRCDFKSASMTLNQVVKEQVVIVDSSNILDDLRVYTYNYLAIGNCSYLNGGIMVDGEFSNTAYVRNQTPTLDNELTSKDYVDTEVGTKQDTITNLVSDNFLTAGSNITLTQNGTNTTINSSSPSIYGFRAVGNGIGTANTGFGAYISSALVITTQAESSYDTTGLYGATTAGVFIPTISGWYRNTCKIFFLSTSSTGGNLVSLMKNQNAPVASDVIMTGGDFKGQTGDFTGLVYMVAGTAYAIRQESGSATISLLHYRSWWECELVQETIP
jgi:hypothetical protein